MKRYLLALLVALLAHLLVALSTWMIMDNHPTQTKKIKKDEQRIKISLKELPKRKISKPTITKPLPKISQFIKLPKPKLKPKKVFKKKKVKKVKTKKPKKPKVKKVKPYIKLEPKPKPKPKKIVKKIAKITLAKELNITKPKEDTQEEPDPMAWMYEDRSDEKIDIKKVKRTAMSSIEQDVEQLYGNRWKELSVGERHYIINYQEVMRQITQRVLTRVAAVNLTSTYKQNRLNTVEFYIYPNGDIDEFKFLNKSGDFMIDETTRETIEYAYKDYPRPTEKTLIRYNFFYTLF